MNPELATQLGMLEQQMVVVVLAVQALQEQIQLLGRILRTERAQGPQFYGQDLNQEPSNGPTDI